MSVAEPHTLSSAKRGPGRLRQAINLYVMAVPIVVFAVMALLSWPVKFTWETAVVLGVMYCIAGFGITIGFHRYFTHRSFETSKFVEVLLAVCGSMAIEGPIISWVADHRQHHAMTDEEGDPHSPHAGFGDGIVGICQGLWHAHWGWLLTSPPSSRKKYAKSLLANPAIYRVNQLFPVIALSAFVIPFGIGYVLTGTLGGALAMLFWAGLIRMMLTHHATWSINSICHVFGSRPFLIQHNENDRSTNFAPLGWLTLGECWHNNHHAFQWSAYHGFGRLQRLGDPSGLVIRLMEKGRLIWNVECPTLAEQKVLLVKQPT